MKKLMVALALALMLMLTVGGGAVLAGDPIDVDVDISWDGGGGIGATVIGGDDAITTFSTGGSHIAGTFTADYTPGSYDYMEVNTLTSRLDALVTGGGEIEYRTERTDGYGGWGTIGQVSYSYVGTDDGNASIGTGSESHLNGLIDYNYPLQGTLAVNSATNYEIVRSLSVGDAWAVIHAWGSGLATLQNRNSAVLSVVEFGDYSGCPTNATFHAVGSGTFNLYGQGDNGTTFKNISMAGSTSGSLAWVGNTSFSGPIVTATDAGFGTSLDLIANYVSGFDMGNYSIRAW